MKSESGPKVAAEEKGEQTWGSQLAHVHHLLGTHRSGVAAVQDAEGPGLDGWLGSTECPSATGLYALQWLLRSRESPQFKRY